MCLAIPGKIINIPQKDDLLFKEGKVSFGGIMKTVNLSLTPDAVVDDYVLVHVGVAISIIDEEEANRTLRVLRDMGELDDLVEN